MKLQELEQWFNENNHLVTDCKLSICEKIIDGKTFIDSHISELKNNSGNPRYLPYYDRLLAYYRLLNKAS